jgi:NAD(P)-dependent dehydrogenase (short-subunit alcohol dehydrogenase family)
MDNEQRFSGKVAIVTGGAGGIGSATARRLSSEGAAVAIFDVKGDAASEVARSLPMGLAVTLDVADDAAFRAAVQSVSARWGGIDILVNNAGGSLAPPAPIWEASPEVIKRITDVNYLSQWFGIQSVFPSMRDRGGGAIVNISSGSAIRTADGLAAYGASKAAVINLTQAAARELGAFNIRVNAIAPGLIRFGKRKANFTEEQAAETARHALQTQALKRIGTPDDIAGAVAFLCSEDARHITGAVLPVNGGS